MSVSLLTLVERLAPRIKEELNLVIKSKEEAESLSSKLKKIHGGLQDAEREGITNNAIKEWLKELEDVAYEMEDVLDEGEMLDLQVKLQGVSPVDPSNFLDKACLFVLLLCSSFKQALFGRRELTKKMKALSDRIDKLLSERNKYNFLTMEKDRGQEFMQDAATSLFNKLEVYGRDAMKDSLVKKLTTSAEGEEEINDVGGTQIVSIVGIGGVGKTTLAQLAYNDAEVNEFFIMKGWVSVSEPFNTSAVAKAILEQFEVSCAAHDLETLVQRIKRAVKDKKFLLVLDNVWTENEEKWNNLKYCLDGAKGSTILVTTRSEIVARMMGTDQWQTLNPLSDLECSQILNGIALKPIKRMEVREKLGGIGVEIAKKCNGLPLAARSVGSMLALKSSEEEWRAVLQSPLWKYKEVSKVFRVMNLSYIDLSPMLKRCFLSSIVFPFKEALTDIDVIIRIWMAYGYLNSNDGYDQVRLQGLEYLSHLEMRSFFQKRGQPLIFQKLEVPSFVQGLTNDYGYEMHDIMYEFANNLLGSEYSLTMDGGDFSTFPWNSLGKLRTFFATNVSQGELPLNSLSHLKSVRLLILRNCNLQLVPEGVGELLHLRYLDLSSNPLSELPQTVCNLYNLQTLCITNCILISSLPEGIGKLINLKHLLNWGTENLVEYPRGFEQLTGLWTLSEFKGSKLECLGNLNQIQGSLSIDLSNLEETADSVEQVRKAKLGDKERIKELTLSFGRNERIAGIVEALHPPPNLQTLLLRSRGKWFSHWIQTSFNNLTQVYFYSSEMLPINLPPFAKLPALENLVLGTCLFKCLSKDFLGLGGDASSVVQGGGFPKLKRLGFFLCFMWEEWEDIKEEGVLRCLEELEIIACNELKGLPHCLLRQATSLKILNLSSNKLYDRYNESGGYDRHQISHIPKVRVNEDNIYATLSQIPL